MATQHPIVPTTITIDPAVRQRLKTFGTHGMTYNDILTRIMDDVQRREFVAEMRRLAEETPDSQWVDLEDINEDGLPRSPPASQRGVPAKRAARPKTGPARGATRGRS